MKYNFRNNVENILFIPYALKDHDEYTAKIKNVLELWNYKVQGIHTHESPIAAAKSAQAFFVGGGNTFQLLKGLYDKKIIDVIRKRVLEEGIPYIGSSAGTNVATLNICTTNDMPIVYPPSFDALQMVPFNINPHYLDAKPGDTHQGETREERILQYLENPSTGPVLGLREGATLYVEGSKATLKGVATARLFIKYVTFYISFKFAV